MTKAQYAKVTLSCNEGTPDVIKNHIYAKYKTYF